MVPRILLDRAEKRGKSLVFFFCLSLAACCLLLAASPVHAQGVAGSVANVNAVATAAGVAPGADLISTIGRIINIFLGFLGVIFLVLLLYAGFLWMTAQGEPKTIEKAKDILKQAIIGLVIIASAWAITTFVLNALTGATTDGGGGITGVGVAPGARGLRGSSGSLGRGIIESHVPFRNATNVPRNTPIVVTFKEAMDPSSFIAGWTDAASTTVSGLNAEAVKIFRTREDESVALSSNKARVRITSDLKTIVIKPIEYLGSPTANVGYTVSLKSGKNGVRKKDGSAAFGGSFAGGYAWQFEVSTVVDLTPPTVISATPLEPGSYPRNAIIQLTFNEAVDPTAVTGRTPNLEVAASDAGKTGSLIVSGEFRISNQYQTVEFVPDVKCGTNACGRDVFCLPGKKTIRVTAKAATLDPKNKPQAQLTTSGYDGVVDLAGNSLDGNNKDGAEGPPGDNYVWSFGTTDDLKLTPPLIESTIPGVGPGKNSNVPLDQSVQATFDTILQGSTVNTDNAQIAARGPSEKDPDTFWWSARLKFLGAKTTLFLDHRPYLPSGSSVATLNYYIPSFSSGIQDQYQNCYNPAGKCAAGVGQNGCNGKPQSAECAFTP